VWGSPGWLGRARPPTGCLDPELSGRYGRRWRNTAATGSASSEAWIDWKRAK